MPTSQWKWVRNVNLERKGTILNFYLLFWDKDSYTSSRPQTCVSESDLELLILLPSPPMWWLWACTTITSLRGTGAQTQGFGYTKHLFLHRRLPAASSTMSMFPTAVFPAINTSFPHNWTGVLLTIQRALPFRFPVLLRVFALKSVSCCLSLTREFHTHRHPSLLELTLPLPFPSVEGYSSATHLFRVFRGPSDTVHIIGSVVPLTKVKGGALESTVSLERTLQALLLLITHTHTPGGTSDLARFGLTLGQALSKVVHFPS